MATSEGPRDEQSIDLDGIVRSKDGLPIFMCSQCGDTDGLSTKDYKHFTCLNCGWVLELN
jgi:predicted RNA-binding Zn-ribbon protein involved in translation (DUF1610 family)